MAWMRDLVGWDPTPADPTRSGYVERMDDAERRLVVLSHEVQVLQRIYPGRAAEWEAEDDDGP
jgi:hypothetical protein